MIADYSKRKAEHCSRSELKMFWCDIKQYNHRSNLYIEGNSQMTTEFLSNFYLKLKLFSNKIINSEKIQLKDI